MAQKEILYRVSGVELFKICKDIDFLKALVGKCLIEEIKQDRLKVGPTALMDSIVFDKNINTIGCAKTFITCREFLETCEERRKFKYLFWDLQVVHVTCLYMKVEKDSETYFVVSEEDLVVYTKSKFKYFAGENISEAWFPAKLLDSPCCKRGLTRKRSFTTQNFERSLLGYEVLL